MMNLDDLILLRLLVPDKKTGRDGVTQSDVVGDLRPLWPEAGAGAAPSWTEAFAAAWGRLTEAGHVTAGGRGGARLGLTPAGTARVREKFGLGEDFSVPDRWSTLRDRHAVPHALEAKKINGSGDLRAALLRRFLLDNARGADTLARAVDLLLARALAVPRPGLPEFRRAVLRRVLAENDAPPPPPVPGRAEARLPGDLPAFATLVRETARGVATGRFGESKIFIVHVWRALVAAGRAEATEAGVFKERLAAAHAAGLLELARADLTGAFDPADVAGSEVHYLHATFHFLRLD